MTTHTLILMRHAQATSFSRRGDKERELTAHGWQSARDAGVSIRTLSPELVLCSSSTRTQQTCSALELGDTAVDCDDGLYEQGLSYLVNRISHVPDAVSVVLIIAHAPTIPQLASQLAEHAGSSDSDELAYHYQPATFTVFRSNAPWSEIANGQTDDLVQIRL